MYKILLLLLISNCFAPAKVTAGGIVAKQNLTSSDRTKSPGGITYYIDPRKGNDGNAGTQKTHPWSTFDKLNRLIMYPGDRVIVSPGTFHRSLYIISKGSARNPVSIIFKPGRFDFYPDSA